MQSKMLFINKIYLLSASLLFLVACQSPITVKQTPPILDEPDMQGIEDIPAVEVKPISVAQQLKSTENLYLNSGQVLSTDVKSKFDRAIDYFNKQEYVKSELILKEIIDLNSALSGPWLKLGDIAKLQNNHDNAIEYYSNAIQINQHNYFARNRLALMLRQQGEFSRAKMQYEQAIISWPGYALTHKNLAILLDLYLGEKELALKEYQLYQELFMFENNEIDKKAKGWIADLKRQIAQGANNG